MSNWSYVLIKNYFRRLLKWKIIRVINCKKLRIFQILYIYKLKPFPQHFGGGHVMEVIRCRCSYLHRHSLQILHSVSWENRFGEEGSHSPCSASFSRLVRQAKDTVAEFYYACWETPAASPSHRGTWQSGLGRLRHLYFK